MKLTEFFLTEGATLEGDVIRNVVVCGPSSKNKRRYSDNALKGAVGLYEGMAVYADHLTPAERRRGRRMEERLGHIENVRFCPDEHRDRGDLRLMESHPMTTRIKEAVAKGLPYFGLSHVADAKGYEKDGTTFVEEVTKVMSVDLVDNAATGTLIEQEEAPSDPFVAAAMALLEDSSMSKDDLLAKLGELWDTLREGKEGEVTRGQPAEGDAQAGMPAPATEQVRPSKPKYIKPRMSAPVYVTEQTDNTVPTDRKALAGWLHNDK